MDVGIIGFGEVGRCIAEALARNAAARLFIVDQQADLSAKAVAEELGATLTDVADQRVGRCDLVLSCVPGRAVEETVEVMMRNGAPGQVLFDLATASSKVKKGAADSLSAEGLYYVDVAIMGAISIQGSSTPMLAAGDLAVPQIEAAYAWLSANGFKLTWLDGSTPGDAASLKLLRSVFTKGMEALAVECLVAAEHFGVRAQLYDVLSDIDQTPLPQFLNMLITTHLVHAKRRHSEVEQAEAQLRDADLPTPLLPSVKALFAQTAAATSLNSIATTPSPQDALAMLKEIGSARLPETQQN